MDPWGVAVWLAVAVGAATLLAPRPWVGRLVALQAALLAAGTARLGWAFVVADWRFAVVADHTRDDLAALARLPGLWAGPEGSLLLWTAMVAAAALVALRLAGPAAGRAGAVVAGAFALVSALAAPAFTLLPAPANGGLGLQPVLEHPAMVWHPPLLYAGLVGMLVPGFAAIGGRVELRRATGVALALLTLGLATGARWAHVELGWGGYWAWDPIESAGLVAWLAGAGLFHGRPDGPAWVRIGSALLPGVAAVWATTLTRVGLVGSVHAFADRPALRISLLTLAGLLTAAAGLFCTLRPTSGTKSSQEDRSADLVTLRPTSGLQRAQILLIVAAVYVALGTYQPLVEAGLGGDRAIVDGRYYTVVLWPLVLVGAAVALHHDGRRLGAAAGGVVGAAALVGAGAGPFALAVAVAGGAVTGSALAGWRSGIGRAVAHAGVGVVLVGVAGTVGTRIAVADVVVDGSAEVAGVEVTHRALELRAGPSTESAVATVELDGRAVETQLVAHTRRGVSTAETATIVRGLDDLQITLLDGDARSARYRVARLPLVNLVWLGAATIAIGLAISAGGQRRRPREEADAERRLRSSPR